MVKKEQIKGYNLIKDAYKDLEKSLNEDFTKDEAEKIIIKINSVQSLKKIAKECNLKSDVQVWQDLENKLKSNLEETGFSI